MPSPRLWVGSLGVVTKATRLNTPNDEDTDFANVTAVVVVVVVVVNAADRFRSAANGRRHGELVDEPSSVELATSPALLCTLRAATNVWPRQRHHRRRRPRPHQTPMFVQQRVNQDIAEGLRKVRRLDADLNVLGGQLGRAIATTTAAEMPAAAVITNEVERGVYGHGEQTVARLIYSSFNFATGTTVDVATAATVKIIVVTAVAKWFPRAAPFNRRGVASVGVRTTPLQIACPRGTDSGVTIGAVACATHNVRNDDNVVVAAVVVNEEVVDVIIEDDVATAVVVASVGANVVVAAIATFFNGVLSGVGSGGLSTTGASADPVIEDAISNASQARRTSQLVSTTTESFHQCHHVQLVRRGVGPISGKANSASKAAPAPADADFGCAAVSAPAAAARATAAGGLRSGERPIFVATVDAVVGVVSVAVAAAAAAVAASVGIRAALSFCSANAVDVRVAF